MDEEDRCSMEHVMPEKEVKQASKMGAHEDLIHTSQNDEGYDLRTPAEIGARQPMDENGNS